LFLVTIDGGWSSWGAWGSCLLTTGCNAEKYRYRYCTSPGPTIDGIHCEGSDKDTNTNCSIECPGNISITQWARFAKTTT